MVFASVFAIVVGLGMVVQWTMSYVSRQIPELDTEPIRIWFHIAAEMATALMLVVGGDRPAVFVALGLDSVPNGHRDAHVHRDGEPGILRSTGKVDLGSDLRCADRAGGCQRSSADRKYRRLAVRRSGARQRGEHAVRQIGLSLPAHVRGGGLA